jgi:hypothetical protein
MVTISERAAALLTGWFIENPAFACHVIKFVRDERGGLGLILVGQPGAGDVALRRANGATIVMDAQLAAQLADAVIDCRPATVAWRHNSPEFYVR